jgi:3-oxoacyl-[acyl-carrier protein] reductase
MKHTMQLGLDNKIALVTGASRGIGRAIALELAQEGCDVVLAARDQTLLRGLATEIERSHGRQALPVGVDLRDGDAADRLLAEVRQRFGRLDLLVNNAGTTKRGDFLALPDEAWSDGFALKFFAHVRLTRALWPLLQAAKGSLITIAGIGGRTPGAEFAIGGAVNAALLSLTKALAALGTRDGVRVNLVNPGPVETDRLMARVGALAESEGIGQAEAYRRMQREMGLPRFGQPGEVAALVAFIASGRAGFMHGALVDIDGGQTKTV